MEAVASEPVESIPPDPIAEPGAQTGAGGNLEGERRTVTVLFADAVGFTSLSEQLDAEKVYELMQGCTRRMSEAVHRFEGNINQFRGDGIMAIFGAPIAQEDSARRAVAAALAMQVELSKYRDSVHEQLPAQCSFRIGLNTGPVVVGKISGTIGSDYTALGDTVNVAARVEQVAEPGSVYISERTYRAVQDYFECEALGEVEIKGKKQPLSLFKVLRERRVQSRLEAAALHGLTDYVGRQSELEMLDRYLEQAAQGQGQVVFISGEAGIGKSRLLLEFERMQAGRPMRWLKGSCISFGRNIAYLPIVEIVKHNFGIGELDSQTDASRKIDQAVEQWHPDARASAAYLKHLLQLGSGDRHVEEMSPQERRAGIFDALRMLMLEASQEQPLVIAIEDLHWVDEQSEEALVALVDAVPRANVLLTITYRPGYSPRLGERSYFNRMALRQLGPEAGAEMAERLMASMGLPSEVKTLLLEKAEGNPFYIEEVAKSLIESGELERNDGKYRLAKPIDEIRIPETIQDVILARIDRLQREARQAMQLASVIGREFTVRLLSRISDLEAHLDDLLGELKGLELIYEKNYFPELSYMFKHALTHDVAYSTMLSERRRALHRMVGRAIEQLYRDRLVEQFETLAHHYFEGQDWNKALEYQLKAAAKASDNFANRDAAAYLGRALEVMSHIPTIPPRVRVEVLERRSRLYMLLNEWELAIEDCKTARELWAAQEDFRHEAIAVAEMAMAQTWGHHFDEAERTLHEAERLARAHPDPGAELAWMNVQSFLDLVRGRLEEAERRIKRAEEVRIRSRLPESQEILGGWCQTLCASFRDRYDESEAAARQAVRSCEQSSVNSPLIYNIRWLRAVNQGRKGDYAAAMTEMHREADFCERVGDRAVQSRVWNSLGWLHGELGDYEASLHFNDQGLVLARELGDPEIMMNAEINFADSLWERGERDAAVEKLEHLLSILDSQHEWMRWRYTQHLLNSLARMLGRRGDFDRALKLVERSLELSERTGSRRNTVKNRRVRGQILLGAGETEAGRRELESSIGLAEELRNSPQLWRSLAALGEWHQKLGHPEPSRESYGRAHEVLMEIRDGLHEAALQRSLETSPLWEQVRLGAAGHRDGYPETLV